MLAMEAVYFGAGKATRRVDKEWVEAGGRKVWGQVCARQIAVIKAFLSLNVLAILFYAGFKPTSSYADLKVTPQAYTLIRITSHIPVAAVWFWVLLYVNLQHEA